MLEKGDVITYQVEIDETDGKTGCYIRQVIRTYIGTVVLVSELGILLSDVSLKLSKENQMGYANLVLVLWKEISGQIIIKRNKKD